METYAAAFTNLIYNAAPYSDVAGIELARVQITRRYSGDAEGESTAELLLCKTPDGVISYAGTDHFVGRLGGRTGSFVYQHAGIRENGTFRGLGFIVPGTATGELAGLRGQATVKVSAAGAHTLHLDTHPNADARLFEATH